MGALGTTAAAKLQRKATEYSADKSLSAAKYRADADLLGVKDRNLKQLQAARYSADKQLSGVRVSSERTLAGVKYSADMSSKARIGAAAIDKSATIGAASLGAGATKFASQRGKEATIAAAAAGYQAHKYRADINQKITSQILQTERQLQRRSYQLGFDTQSKLQRTAVGASVRGAKQLGLFYESRFQKAGLPGVYAYMGENSQIPTTRTYLNGYNYLQSRAQSLQQQAAFKGTQAQIWQQAGNVSAMKFSS